MTDGSVICLFVKSPVPGRVKTRLALEIGARQACRVYCHLVESIVASIHASEIPLALFYDGEAPDRLPEPWRRHAVICCRQEGAGLGERMDHAFRRLFAEGYRSVLLCGSDIIGLDRQYLKNAATELYHAELVIAPARDGGYCLIGLTAESFNPIVFEQIRWSTDQVLAQTLEQCREAKLKPVLLRTLRDIDTFADLQESAPGLLAMQ